jgi:hypothetical protein
VRPVTRLRLDIGHLSLLGQEVDRPIDDHAALDQALVRKVFYQFAPVLDMQALRQRAHEMTGRRLAGAMGLGVTIRALPEQVP